MIKKIFPTGLWVLFVCLVWTEGASATSPSYLMEQAYVALKMGTLEDAISSAKAAEEAIRQEPRTYQQQLPRFYRLMVAIKQRTGELDEAEAYLERGLAHQKKHYDKNDMEIGIWYRDMGSFYERHGRLEEAERFYLKNHKIFMKAGDRFLNPQQISVSMAEFYAKHGMQAKAEPFVAEALGLVEGRRDLEKLQVYRAVGKLYADSGKAEQALRMYEKEIALEFDTSPTGVALLYGKAGETAYELGEYHDAAQYLQKAITAETNCECEGHNHSHVASWERKLADAQRQSKTAK